MLKGLFRKKRHYLLGRNYLRSSRKLSKSVYKADRILGDIYYDAKDALGDTGKILKEGFVGVISKFRRKGTR